MGLFSWFKRTPDNYYKYSLGDHWYITDHSIEDIPFDSLKKVYECTPHLRSVIDRKSQLFSNAKLEVVREKDGEKTPVAHPVNTVLSSPNFMQSLKGFLYMIMTYKCISGDAFIFPKYSIGNRARNIKTLWNIDYDDFKVDVKNNAIVVNSTTVNDYINKYQFWVDGQTFKVLPEEIIHIKDYGTSYKEGKSRISTLRDPIQNIHKALKSRGVLAARQGGIGILARDAKEGGFSPNMLPDEKKAIENAVNSKELGGKRGSIHVTDIPMKWQSMVFSTKDLMLFEEIEDDFHAICDAYDMPREIFEGQSNYSNKEHAERAAYQDTIIPEWKDFAGVLTRGLGLDKEGLMINVKYDHIQVLQEDEEKKELTKKNKSERLMAELEKKIITVQDYRKQMGYV